MALLLLPLATVAADAQVAPGVEQFLRKHFAVSTSDLRQLASGAPFTRSLSTEDGREIATVGAVRVRVTPEFYMTRLRDIATFKQDEAVLQIGVFGTPAARADLRSLTLPSGMARTLRRCRPHDCDVQLSTEAMALLRAGDQSEAALTTRFASVLADVAQRYANIGGSGLMTYDDDDVPISADAEFARLVNEPPAVLKRFPMLLQHVQRFPRNNAEMDDLLYWSRERLGPVDVVSITHLALAPRLQAPPLAAAAVSRQVYASKYFDASLGLTLLLQGDAGERATYVVYINRSRIDALDGWFGAVKRTMVRSRTRSGMKSALARIQRRLEQQFATKS